jgi:predicted alpha/beta superfamily hydrolase
VGWERYQGETVSGNVRVLRGELDRDLLAYLPPSHGLPGRRFPVVYMHDGQNLFDEATANTGEWRVDETMEDLAREGIEAIVVGIPHAGELRGHEYADDGARAYLDFVVDRVRPLVETAFAADVGRRSTGIAGSSLGGISSLHALYAYPDVFGFAGVLSPAFWWNGDDRWYKLVEREPRPAARIYMDVGDDEGEGDERIRRAYVDGFERMAALLRRKGHGDDDLRVVLEPGGVHLESAWARRLPDAFRFLLRRIGRA